MKLKRRKKAVILLEAFMAGMIVEIGSRKYKLENEQIYYEVDVIRTDSNVINKKWIGLCEGISALFYLASQMTDNDSFIVAADITLNDFNRRKRDV